MQSPEYQENFQAKESLRVINEIKNTYINISRGALSRT
jgi:hypothetical protein